MSRPKSSDSASRGDRPNTLSKADYEELGRRLENIYLVGYISKKEMLKMSFLKGIVAGFGGVVGATIVVGLVVWILSLFHTIPFIGPLVDNAENTVKTQKK
ncbi:MAG TPA: DUF5665 domain-containing protein [Candidatus Limnocylindria bacterium]|nr:DUF5665 domain-containing protein [Candidatus Limnocylindria bacterium]